VGKGLDDLAAGRRTTEALLVAIAAPRLRWLGIRVPATLPLRPENALYEHLAAADPRAAHGQYNAWIRRLVSFEHALEHRVFRERRRARSAEGS
jgi:hypothetical protein